MSTDVLILIGVLVLIGALVLLAGVFLANVWRDIAARVNAQCDYENGED